MTQMQAPTLVIVEDDQVFARTLRRSFERRGYTVSVANGPEDLVALLAAGTFGHAVVDLKLGTASGLECVQTLHAHDPAMLIVVLTGFASISSGSLRATSTGGAGLMVGPMPRRRRASSAMRLKIGAATVPP